MHNVYQQFRQLLPDPPLQAGTVTAWAPASSRCNCPVAAILTARGDAQVGQTVFVRDDVIEGVAPSLTLEVIEI